MGGINSHQDKPPEKNVQVPDAIELTSDLTPQLRLFYPTLIQNGAEVQQGPIR